MTLDERVTQARRHVETGRSIVERQRALCVRDSRQACFDLLETFEACQRIFEEDLVELLKRRDNTSPERLAAWLIKSASEA